MRQGKVYVKNTYAGLLTEVDKEHYTFVYDDNYLMSSRAEPGDVVLTPAYDLMNTSLHLHQGIFALKKGLFKEGMVIDDTHSVTRASFLEFGQRLGLTDNLINRELDKFAKEYPLAEQLIENSHLSPALKEYYKGGYHYRLTTLKTIV